MIFTSFNFIIFFPIVVTVYYLLPNKFRYVFLLIASYYFYANINPLYTLLLAGVTISTFVFTRLIENSKLPVWKRRFLIIDIFLVISPLFFFKYFGFINHALLDILGKLGILWPLPDLKLLLPVGISFYTFVALGYAIDVYNEQINAEKNLGIVALFLSFFPLILSGPIERAPNMLPQLKSKLSFNYKQAVTGIKLILWGYFMKLVIAERIALYVNAIFHNIDFHSGSSLLLATLLYPVQVYGDLGGYSLIAIGCANVMGINVMQNFNRPFFAKSMSEFWRRWHISLIKWLTDYIYTPLSFKLRKYKIWGIVIALLITFMLSGLWHGATFPFIFWGTFQGVLLSLEALSNRNRIRFENKYGLTLKKWYIFLNVCLTYLIFSFSLIFGVIAHSMSEAFSIIRKIFSQTGPLFIDEKTLGYSLIGIVILFSFEFISEYFPGMLKLLENKSIFIRWSAYLIICFLIIMIGVFNGGQFIYFQY